MNAFFKRQLADYVEYHRDPLELRDACVRHHRIVLCRHSSSQPCGRFRRWACTRRSHRSWCCRCLFIGWLLDAALGAAILGAAVALLSAAAFVVSHASTTMVWSITAVLIVAGIGFQVIGHRVFEQRQPALVDNPSHLLLGPMFVMAKLFIALGFRRDLAAIIQPVPPQAQRGPSSFTEEHQVEPLPRS